MLPNLLIALIDPKARLHTNSMRVVGLTFELISRMIMLLVLIFLALLYPLVVLCCCFLDIVVAVVHHSYNFAISEENPIVKFITPCRVIT